MNIRTKILIFILASSILIFALAIGIITINNRQYSISNSKKIVDLYSTQSSYIVKSILEADLHTVKTLKNTMESNHILSSPKKTDIYRQILQNVLIDNHQFLSVMMSWELSMVDKEWQYPYGRISTSTLLENGKVIFYDKQEDIEDDNLTSIYYKMKTGELKEILKDPYFYTYSEKDTGTSFLETRIAEPIIINGNFYGIVGVDISLKRFQSIIEQNKPFSNSHLFIVSNNGTIVAHKDKQLQGEKITKVLPEYSNYYDIIDNIQSGNSFSFTLENTESGNEYISFSPLKIGQIKTPWAMVYVVPMDIITREALQNLKISIFIFIIGMFFLTVIILLMIQFIIKPITKTTNILKELEKGNINAKYKLSIKRKDEMGKMTLSVNNLIDALNNTAIFAKKIGQGDLTAEYKMLSNSDILGTALIDMKKNLIKAKEQEGIRQTENTKLSWSQTGLTEVNELLRLENEDLDKLSYAIIKYIVKYLNANQGGFYIITMEDKKQMIELSAAFAYDRKKLLEAKVEVGEGLIGRCVREKNIIHISNLPEGYLYITSGLGEKSPSNLLITPLIFEGSVYGIMEIASLHKFEDYQIDFIRRVSDRIASTISNLKKTLRTAELLKESQEQAEILQSKEKEIENRMNALKNAQKEVELSELETAGLLDAISHTASIVQYDMNGNIININDKKLALLGLSDEVLVGRNQSEFAIEAKENPQWYKQFWDDLRAGKNRKRIFRFEKDDIKIIYDETYIPIKDAHGKSYKVINFSIDITENMELKDEIIRLKSNKK